MATTPKNDLNAVNLKHALWSTLRDLRSNEIDANVADAIACQAREIIRTTRIQTQILSLAGLPMSVELVDFAAPKE